jgi:hypothetical protein
LSSALAPRGARAALATALVGACLAAFALTAVVRPAPAGAYSHTWNCNYGLTAYSTCYDNTGIIYNPWVSLMGEFLFPLPSGFNGMCLKAVTAAGNIKSGSHCEGPSLNRLYAYLAASPTSHAYYYLGGSGISGFNDGHGDT